MIHRLRASITGKLFLLICFLLLITILPLFLTVNAALTQLGDYVYATNAQQIKSISDTTLSTLVSEQAQKYDGIFTRIKASVAFLALKGSDIYGNMEMYSQNPIETIPLKSQKNNQIFYTPRSHPIITAYWGNQNLSPGIKKEIRALSHLNPYLKKVQELTPESMAAHVITQSGIGRYYTTEPMVKNLCYNLPPPEEFDLRNGEPVTTFTRQKPKDYSSKLTSPYKDDVIDGFMITATAPILDGSGRFRGIAGIDIPLANILGELTQQNLPQKRKMGIFFGFLMDKNGRFIAYPKSHFDFFGLEINPAQFKYSRDILDLNITDITSPGIKKAVTNMLNSKNSLTQLKINNDKYIFAAHSLSATGWHLVLVSREKDLLFSVYQTQKAVKKSLSQISSYFLKHSMTIFLMAILIVYGTVKIIVHPIKRLTRLAQSVSEGDRTMVSHIDKKDEIGVLAKAFNQMVKKLNISEKNEKNHAEYLKKEILHRTKELQASNHKLEQAREKLESIVAKRTQQLKLLNEHLVYSEEIERKAIASDLHDTIAQALAMGISKIKTMREPGSSVNPDDLMKIQGFLEQSIRGIRSLIYKLSPPILDDFEIDIAIGFLVEETNAQHHTQITYMNNLEDPVALKKPLKIMLYRATDELITNILKYAGTNEAEIDISLTDEGLCIRVKDNGAGMEVKKIHRKGGFGLYYISQRMENFNGQLIIKSQPGQGTDIRLIAPII
jgi:signal transduction histidine kinase